MSPRNAPRIIATNFKAHQKNTLRGFVDLRLPDVGVVLMGATLHEKNASRWVSMPARPYQNDQGQTCWAQIIDFTSREAREEFQSAALRAIDAIDPVSANGDETGEF